MKHYRKMMILVLSGILIFFIGLLGYCEYVEVHQDKSYYIEMNDIAMRWQQTKKLPENLESYKYIETVTVMPLEEGGSRRVEGDRQTVYWSIYDEKGKLEGFLCFKYKQKDKILLVKVILLSLGVMLLFMGVTFIYIYRRFIKPLTQMEKYSDQMGRGNMSSVLSVLPQSNFKKLRWGLKMLEDELATTTKKNFALEKQRQTLLTSIAHGIKTPVSNIILYTSAIREKIYPEERFPEMIMKIEDNANRIHKQLEELLKAASKKEYDVKIEKKEFYPEIFIHFS